MILVSRTFTIITPESGEEGDFSDLGYVYEDVEFTFGELVRELKDGEEMSCWPATGSVYEWVTMPVDLDYCTGEERQESVHFSHKNLPRAAKYWRKALQAAGLIRRQHGPL